MEASGASLEHLISRAIAAHDPLDPWLVVSNYDDHYWDELAATVAPSIANAETEDEVYAALATGLRDLVTISDADPYARDRIRQAAAALWRSRGRPA